MGAVADGGERVGVVRGLVRERGVHPVPARRSDGAGKGDDRVVRGGSWLFDNPGFFQCDDRSRNNSRTARPRPRFPLCQGSVAPCPLVLLPFAHGVGWSSRAPGCAA